jgi:acetyl-CoA acetyltransferase
MPQGPLYAAGAHDQHDRDAAQAAGKFAAEQVLDRAGWKTADIQRIEINEAFAAISIAGAKDLGLNADVVNVEGGAIAHPDRRVRRSAHDVLVAFDEARWS